jgi:hypothetical protein
VTLAKIAAGVDGELITWDAAGDPATVGVGTAGQILTSNGAGAAPTFQAASAGLSELTTFTTTSGTSHETTAIPAGTVEFVVVMVGVSISGTDDLLIELGKAGPTYASVSAGTEESQLNGSQGVFNWPGTGPAVVQGIVVTGDTFYGIIRGMKTDTDDWVITVMGADVAGAVYNSAGYIAVGGTLDRLKLTTDGANTFDLGRAVVFTR